jgi:hypothetical protein
MASERGFETVLLEAREKSSLPELLVPRSAKSSYALILGLRFMKRQSLVFAFSKVSWSGFAQRSRSDN